ncbi:MAG TPA: hypothetical protein VI461_16320, partial [Chitinophagaceae bacterium]|nr:hypothetical protein [Chitinophagaceae bacterium]
MRHEILKLPGEIDTDRVRPAATLSFKPFLDYIREQMEDTETIKKDIYQLILHKFSKHPELEGEVELEDTAKYKDILNLLYIALSTVVEDEKNVRWGIAVPVSPVIFYGSNPLYELMSLANNPEINLNFDSETQSFARQKCEMLYAFLLSQFYNFHFPKEREMIRSVFNNDCGLVKYYRINIDTRFVTVTATQPLPDINREALQLNLHEDAGLEMLMKTLPLSYFHFNGFSILTITDVT